MSKKIRKDVVGVGSFIAIGIAGGVLMAVVPSAAVEAVVLSTALFCALISTFRSKWSDFDFWLTIVIFLTLHTALMFAVGERIVRMTLYPILFLLLPEGILMVIIILLTARSSD
jgi:ABC-type transport system involved in cytochrome c biogenesis permease subunit